MGRDRGRRRHRRRGRGCHKKLIERVAWDLAPAAPHAAHIIAAALEAGDQATVDELTPPEIPDEARFAYAAFAELSTDRAIGMAAGPIPFSAIDAYAARYRIADPDEFDRFRVLIRAIERERIKERE